jgi:hypothetical protein
VDTSGIITTFAGTGLLGYSGDGGPATQARLYYPLDVTGDNEGNIYIGTYYGIRKVDTSGVITTYAGGGNRFPPFDDVSVKEVLLDSKGMQADSEGNLFVESCHSIHRIDKAGKIRTLAGKPSVSTFAGDGGPAALAVLYDPHDAIFT